MDGRDLVVDKISDLPDPLITQILSLLTTEEAVRTCILSKKWIDLWTSMTTLDFDYHISGFDSEVKFLRFVHGVLNRRGFSPLDNFKLVWQSRSQWNHDVVEECINHAIACMPRVIHIYMDTDLILKFPDSLFNCRSIKEMSLLSLIGEFSWMQQLPKSLNLPSLKKLDIGCMFIMDKWINMILLGCSVLEELVLTSCWLMFIEDINSNVLKKFTLKKCYFSYGVNSITFKNAPSLVMADFEITRAHDKLNLLGILPNVTSLRLYTTTHYLELFSKDIPNCPIFNNLRSFELGELTMRYGWNLVACFLQHSPNIKKLVLNFRHESEVNTQEALPKNFSFQHDFLEIVEIKIKEGSKETVKEVIKTLGAHVKTIVKIVIL